MASIFNNIIGNCNSVMWGLKASEDLLLEPQKCNLCEENLLRIVIVFWKMNSATITQVFNAHITGVTILIKSTAISSYITVTSTLVSFSSF